MSIRVSTYHPDMFTVFVILPAFSSFVPRYFESMVPRSINRMSAQFDSVSSVGSRSSHDSRHGSGVSTGSGIDGSSSVGIVDDIGDTGISTGTGGCTLTGVKARKFVSMRHAKRAEDKRLAMSTVSSAGSCCTDEEKAQTMIGSLGTVDEAGVPLEVSLAGGANTGVDSGAGGGDFGSEWQRYYDENTGHYYWLHGTTGESTWHDPFA